ncbi:MAG: hypothetical protein ABFD50_04565 [Smithella sp.]
MRISVKEMSAMIEEKTNLEKRIESLEEVLKNSEADTAYYLNRCKQLDGEVFSLRAQSHINPPVVIPCPISVGAKLLFEMNEKVDWVNDLSDSIREGSFINAIKIFREHTGAGLKEAKDICEVFRDMLKAKDS